MANAEKMLVCNALDERDFLRKKIVSQIKTLKVVGVKRVKDKKVANKEVATFESDAKSNYQSLNDLIDRYNRLDVAITLANATTEITLSDGTKYTRAAAIVLRKTISGNSEYDFTGSLLATMKRQWDEAQENSVYIDKKADNELEAYKNNITSADKSKTLDENTAKTLEALVADNRPQMIDPIGVANEIEKVSEKYNVLLKELDSAIKVSNATTYVEF